MLLAAAALGHHAEEDPRLYLAGLLQRLPLHIAGFEQGTQRPRHREHAALAVLRGAGIQPYLAALEVHLTPLQRQHLRRDAPAGDGGELDEGLNGLG